MKKEIPTFVIVITAIVVIGGVVALFIMKTGTGKMTSEQEELAERQGQIGNERMQGYVPDGIPGGPGGSNGASGEAAARASTGAGGQ